MPGILGIVTPERSAATDAHLVRMLDVASHEPFYSSGRASESSVGISLGWVRRDGADFAGVAARLSGRGTQLFLAGDDAHCASNDRMSARLADHLRGLGSSVPVSEWHAVLRGFLQSLNGRFHGFLIDPESGSGVLFNDRYGMHRLYYRESPDAFYFASEAKSILAVCPESRRLDMRGVGELLSCSCVLENRSIFAGIKVLPPGACWVFQKGRLVEAGSYFAPAEWEDLPALDPDSYYEELRGCVKHAVARSFSGRHRVTMSLTGGLDSRIAMAWGQSPPDSVPCHSFVGPIRECEDARLARDIARICRQPHQTLLVGPDFLSRFGHYAERAVYLSDGCVSAERAYDLMLNEKVRQIAPVRMTGNYGGEVLRQVIAFKFAEPCRQLFVPELHPFFAQAAATYADVLRAHPVTFAAFRQAPWYHFGVLRLEESQVAVRTPFLDNELVRAAYLGSSFADRGTEFCLRLIADGNPELALLRTDLGLGGAPGLLPASVRYRAKKFGFRLEYAYSDGMPDWLVRIERLLGPLGIERRVLGRNKFAHYRVWFRDNLAQYLRETLLDERSLARPYLNRRFLRTMVETHVAGTANFTKELHQVLTLELLQRTLTDGG